MAEAVREAHGHDVVLVGASTGWVEALISLVSRLPEDLPAAVFIVLHIAAQAPNLLPQILARNVNLVVKQAEDGDPIRHGRIYVAPPDHHLLIDRGFVRVVHGPKENLHRPSIDALFRSAARPYGPRCIGVVLTGVRDDGTAGMAALKGRGDIAIVQEPKDAMYPSMPLNVLEKVEVDYEVPLDEIPDLITRLAALPAERERVFPVSDDLNTEAKMVEQEMDSKEMIASLQNSEAFQH